MSGLEAVASFALACNVIQVVEAGYKTVGTCKRIYQTGQPDPALGDYGGQLRDISSALETQLNKTTGPLSPDDTHLRDLAARCGTIANGLLDQIASVSKSAGKRTIGSSIRLAIKSRFKQSDLNRWEKDLAKAQSTMETQLLVGLRQRVDANMLQNDDMDRELKYFVRQLSDGQTSLSNLILRQAREIKEEISKGFTEAEAFTKTHITTELLRNDNDMQDHVSKVFSDVQVVVERQTQEESASRAQEKAYRHLLSSLKFPEMEARRNHVSHACPKTFRWILDSRDSSSNNEYGGPKDDWKNTDSDTLVLYSPSNSPSWDSLAEWLQSSEPVYWISGKPGSGKSTLMKFILAHYRTELLLKQWQSNVRILSHFFWRPGTELQQSIKGLLCSLLHQIFVQDKDQALSYLETRRKLSWKDSSTDWDPRELQGLLIDYLCRPSAAFCLFIDGLDEVWPKDGAQNLILLLKTLLQKSNRLKLCVSSRPEHLLENDLGDYPQLKMHDLIQNDLKKYATQVLSEASSHGNLDKNDISYMVRRIVRGSQGVFLWAVLVSKSLSRGIQNGDSLEELFQRLDSLPRDLEGLYMDMWLRQNEDDEIYRKSSAKLLYLCLTALGWKERPQFAFNPPFDSGLQVFQLMVAMDDGVVKDHLIHRHSPAAELRERCQATAKMIRVRSAGLLEICECSQDDIDYNTVLDDRVRFIHRSAHDFLSDTELGQAVLKDHGMTYDLACTKLYLAHMAITPYLIDSRCGSPSSRLASELHTLARHGDVLEPSTIRHCLQETAKYWHHYNASLVDQIHPGRHDVLVEAARWGFFDYASEQLSMEQNESSVIPRLFLHSACTHGWMGWPFFSWDEVAQRNTVDGQCRLLRLFLDKVAFRDPKPFILPPVGDGGSCCSISQILGRFLLFVRESLEIAGSVFAQVLLDTLGTFKGTPVDLTEKLLLNLDLKRKNTSLQFSVSLFEPGVTIDSRGTECARVEISLRDWVDATRCGLYALITGNSPITRDKSYAPHMRFVSLISENTVGELCRYTPDESDVSVVSQLAQDLLYGCFYGPELPYLFFLDFFNKVASLRNDWAKSILKPMDGVRDRATYIVCIE